MPRAGLSWWQNLQRWWAEFSLQTKLLAAATLVVSLVMTGITFFALNGIQADDFDAAFEGAYAALATVNFEGINYRRDIGHQVRRRPSSPPS